MKRIQCMSEHSAEEKARLQAIRDQFQTSRPSLDALGASGEYTEPVQHGVTLDAMHIASLLKQTRQEAALSLTEAAQRCGLDHTIIRQLENSAYENTTIQILSRLANAYGKRCLIQLVDAE